MYVGGDFLTAGGIAAQRIARWDGTSWSALGALNGPVSALSVFDDGLGPALYAGGDFTTAGGLAANRIARWDGGTSWSALGSGTDAPVAALSVFDDGTRPALIAGGVFMSAPDSGDSYVARYVCTDATPPTLSCPSSITVNDVLPDGLGEVVTFVVTATDNLDPAPVVVCVPPSGTRFPTGTTLVECTATDASGNESTCAFPVTVRPRLQSRKP